MLVYHLDFRAQLYYIGRRLVDTFTDNCGWLEGVLGRKVSTELEVVGKHRPEQNLYCYLDLGIRSGVPN